MAELKKKLVPLIRFKGFSDEWDERSIGEVLTEKKRPIELEDDKLYELVTVRRRNGGVVSRGYLHGKDILVKNYFQLRAKDFIISKRQVVHGATGIVPQHLNKAIVSNEYMVAVGNENILSEYLTIISTLPDMYRKFFLSSYGVDIEKLFFDAADWKKRNVVIPKLTEQDKICSYFAELDQVIHLHQLEHEKLSMLKKAMLNKMFPQNGAITPEIRFKGFSGPWDEKKLGELVDLHSGRDYKHLSSGNIPVYGTGGYMTSVDQALSYNEDAVGIGRKGTIDNPFMLKAPFWTVDTLFYAVPKGKNDIYFIYDIFQQIDWKQKDESTGVPSLSKFTINNVVILSTNPEEQQKIGNYFRIMDKLIAQHGSQVERLKQIKTACLKKMFV